MNFSDSQTKQNLAISFASECQAGARYQFIATLAQGEQLTFIKDTMKLLAKNEMAHAKLFYDYIADKCDSMIKVGFGADFPYVKGELGNTLRESSKIEQEEFDTIYPQFARIAREEGFEEIANSFDLVAAVEKTHAGILRFLSDNYDAKKLYKYKINTLQKCSNCGHIDFMSDGWKKCPLCSFPQGAIEISFAKIFEASLNV